MIKRILFFTTLCFVSLANAQLTMTTNSSSTDVSGTTLYILAPNNVDTHVDIRVTNTGSTDKYWKVRRKRLTTPPSQWTDYVCWAIDKDPNGACYGHSEQNPWNTPDPLQHYDNNTGNITSGLLPNEVGVAAIHCTPSDIGGSSTYRYYIYEEGKQAEDSVDIVFTTVAAVKDVKSTAVSINVYPNPATNYLTVSPNGITDTYAVRMTDVLGKVVYEEDASGNKKIDVSDFKNGVYLVSVYNEGTLVQTKRIVVKH